MSYDDGEYGSGGTGVLRWIPVDLVVVLAVLGLANVLLVTARAGSFPYLLFAVPVLLFVPGYLLLAAVFPRRPDRASRDLTSPAGLARSQTWTSRLVLSFLVSVAFVPVVGGLLVVLDRPFEPPLVAGVLSGFVIIFTVLAWARRLRVPADERLGFPLRRWLATVRTRWLKTGGLGESVATVALLVGVALVLSSLVLAAGAPADGEGYTTVTLLTEDESGELTVGDYSTDLVQHQAVPIVASVENSEGASQEYTMVVRLEQLSNESNEVRDARRLTSEELSLAAGETVNRSVTVSPREVGPNQRVSFYLYRGGAPADVGPDTAYRHAYLEITVREPLES